MPLILLNGRRFSGQRYETIGGLIDVAPTVMDLLGLASPSGWQGRSFFSSRRAGRAYFFSPFSRFLFGLRDGDLKLIIDASRSVYEVYDLRRDPKERTNIAGEMTEFVRHGERRIAAWVQYQNRFYRELLKDKPGADRAARQKRTPRGGVA